jgi:hypothetical protein
MDSRPLSHRVRSADILVQVESGAAAGSRKPSASLKRLVMYEWQIGYSAAMKSNDTWSVKDGRLCMTHYIAVVEEGEGKAIGVWFPDLPGCDSAGDTLDEAMQNAAEAVGTLGRVDDRNWPKNSAARRLANLKADPEVAQLVY